MLRITKQATGLDLLVVEKKLERYRFLHVSTTVHVDGNVHSGLISHLVFPVSGDRANLTRT